MCEDGAAHSPSAAETLGSSQKSRETVASTEHVGCIQPFPNPKEGLNTSPRPLTAKQTQRQELLVSTICVIVLLFITLDPGT